MDASDVTAVIVTRGDQDLAPVLESLDPVFGDRVVVWNNRLRDNDFKVYGYFSALAEVDTPYVMTQADDAIIPAQELLDAWTPDDADRILLNVADGDTPWISFGGLFRTDLPWPAISRYLDRYHDGQLNDEVLLWCEVVFCELTAWRNVDLGKRDLPWCSAPNRMWMQPNHYSDQAAVRAKCLELAGVAA